MAILKEDIFSWCKLVVFLSPAPQPPVKIFPIHVQSGCQQAIAHLASWLSRVPMAILPSGFSSPNQGLFRHVPCGFQLFCWSFHPPMRKTTNLCDNNIDCKKKCFMVCLYFTLLFRVTFSDVMEISPPKSLKKEKLWRKSRQKKKKKQNQHTCWYGNQTVNDCNFSLLLKFHKPPSFPKGRLPPREGHFARLTLHHCSSFAVEQKSTALDAKCP